MKKIIKKTAFILIFCFSTVYIFSPTVYASHNRRDNGTTENWGNGGKWIDFTGIILGTAVLVGITGGIYYLLKKGPDFSNKKSEKAKKEQDEEAEEKIKTLENKIKELESKITKSEKKDKNYKSEKESEENDWSLFEERHKEKEEGIEIWKRRGEDNKKNKKIKPATKSEDDEEEEENDNRENSKIKEVNF